MAGIREFITPGSRSRSGGATTARACSCSPTSRHAPALRARRVDGALRPLTDEKEPVERAVRPGADRLIVQHDDGGNERTSCTCSATTACSAARRGARHAMHDAGGVSRDGRLLAYRTNRRNGVDFDVVVRDLTTGGERCVYERGGYAMRAASRPTADWLTMSMQTERSGDNDVFLVGVDRRGHHVAPHDDASYTSGPAWLPDGAAFYFVSDVGRDVPAVARFEIGDANLDIRPRDSFETECVVDPAGAHLLVATNEEGWTRAVLRDPSTLELQGEVPLPGHGVASMWTFTTTAAPRVPLHVAARPGRRVVGGHGAATPTRLTTARARWTRRRSPSRRCTGSTRSMASPCRSSSTSAPRPPEHPRPSSS